MLAMEGLCLFWPGRAKRQALEAGVHYANPQDGTTQQQQGQYTHSSGLLPGCGSVSYNNGEGFNVTSASAGAHGKLGTSVVGSRPAGHSCLPGSPMRSARHSTDGAYSRV